MGYIKLQNRQLHVGMQQPALSVIYLIDSPEHPLGIKLPTEPASTVVLLPVATWGDALTPWPADAPYREEPAFGGHAQETLDELLNTVIPAVEDELAAASGVRPTRRAICGYSLGGLFSLYAFTHSDAFDACGCLSGSVWYEGWIEYLRTLDLQLAGRYAYFSLGTKEKHGGQPLMRTVQKRMTECVELLREHGCKVDFALGPGTHLQHIPTRIAAGLAALDDALQAP